MTETALTVRELRYSVRQHFWSRTKTLLDGVSFTVGAGKVFGFVGPNGAGKTTTIKALIGLFKPQHGKVEIFGEDASKTSARRELGFLPERAYFSEHIHGRELLVLHGQLAGMTLAASRKRADELLETVGLRHAATERLGGYSKGMQQRIGIAQALVSNPKLVVLDEPMSGLDPFGRRDVRALLLQLRDRGTTVFFSTHILPDVEAICEEVALIVRGRVVRSGRVGELLEGTVRRVDLAATGIDLDHARTLATDATYVGREGGQTLLELPTLESANRALDALRSAGATITSVQAHRATLEDVFVAAAGNRDMTKPDATERAS